MSKSESGKFKIITKPNFAKFVNALIKGAKYRVVGVKEKDAGYKKYAFDDLENASELRLDYDLTVLPPKKYFYPPKESYLKFNLGGPAAPTPILETKPVAIIGAHPYDIRAIELMDKVFSETFPDPNYLSRKENSAIIGIHCLNPYGKSFAKSMGTTTVERGFDLMLTDLGANYLVEIGTVKGEKLLEKYATVKKAAENDISSKDKAMAKAAGKYKLSIDGGVKAFSSLVEKSYDHSYWAEIAEKCFACSSCTMVCPTCVCFDVREDVGINLKEGTRSRNWDSCLVDDFAKVGTGENFRENKSSRTRHRMLRKGKYMLDRFGIQGCVGCGRCITACLPDIASPVEAYKRLKGEK
ncbi:MAG: 4Fe-4S dicluster domain-containing protein [Planctomycetes bacterium]|nr:4Fe-4S dicluster domain-containing protein [Planctomycetota bacterium]